MTFAIPLLALALAAAPAPAAKGKRAAPAPTKAVPPAPPKASPAPAPAPAAPPAAAEPAAPPAAAPDSAPAPVPASAAAPEEPKRKALRVAVLVPSKHGEVDERALAAFLDALVPELRKLEGVAAIGMNEVREMLEFDRQRQLLGCSEESCLSEIGGALGADDVLTTQLTLIGSSYTLSMRRMNLRKAKVVGSETKKFDKRDGEEVLAMVGPLIAALFPDRELRPGRTRGVDQASIRRLNPPPLPRWSTLGTGALAIVAAAAGGMFGMQANSFAEQFRTAAQRSLTEPVSSAELKTYQSNANSSANRANVLYGVAGGLLLVGVVEALFTDWRDDGAALKPQLMVAPGGGGVGVTGAF